MKLRIIILLISMICFGCDTTENERTDTISDDIIKSEWINSIEEETDSVKIYRQSDFMEFPVLRYRQKYKFEVNNNCKYFVLDPRDAHHYKSGKWEIDNVNNILKIFDMEDQIVIIYKVEEISPTILKMIEIK